MMTRFIRLAFDARLLVAADQAIVSAANFALTLILFRLLGPHLFGLYTIFFVIQSMAQTVHHSAVNMLLMSKLAGRQRAADVSLRQEMAVYHLVANSFITVASTMLFAIFFVYLQEQPALTILFVAALAFFLTQSHDYTRRYFFSSNRPTIAFLVDLFRFAPTVFFFAWLLCRDLQIDLGEAIVVATIGLIIPIVPVLVSISLTGIQRTPIPWSRVRQCAKEARWLTFSAVLQVASGNAHFLIVGALLGPIAVTALRAAQTIMSPLSILLQGLENYVPVRATRIYAQNGRASLQAYLAKSASVVCLIMLPVIAVLVLFPNTLATIFFGVDIPDIAILVYSFAAVLLAELAMAYGRFSFRAVFDTKPILWAYAAQSLATLFVAPPLVLSHGVIGAALSILIARMFGLLVLSLFFRRHHYPT